MKHIFVFFFAGFFVFQGHQVLSQEAYDTTSEMLSYCDGTSELGIDGEVYCTGYISALLDTSVIWEFLGAVPLYCLPENGISVNEAIIALESYVRRNPEELDEMFLVSMFLALGEKYPC